MEHVFLHENQCCVRSAERTGLTFQSVLALGRAIQLHLLAMAITVHLLHAPELQSPAVQL